MPRYKLTIEYDGAGLAGWQRQAHMPSVQAHMEAAIHAFCQETVELITAGRTDAGVHALGQVTHLDFTKTYDPYTILMALNEHLRPHRIAVLQVERAADNFHARFDAKKRHYVYRIINRRARLAMDENRAWHIPTPLNAAAMHEAAQSLLGTHDFTSFRDSHCQARSPVKTLDQLDVARNGEEIRITASSRSFLHHQVRIMVGTLTEVGKGKWTAADVKAALKAKDRRAAGPTAPSEGLYLVKVDY